MAEPFPVTGNIDPASFPHLLVDLHRHGATGSLKVTGPNHPKALYFRGGRILFGSSNDPRDQLGAILIESGRITRQQLDEVNAKVGPGNPLAKVLSDSGFVNQRELGDAARTKVERILADVLSWASGSFEFEDGVLPKGAVDLKLSTEKLLLAAVQRIPDRAFALRHVDLDTVLEPDGGGETALGEIRAEVWPLFERLDGSRTLKDAISLTRLDEFEAAKTACALLFLGIVRARNAEPELDLAQEAQSGFSVPEEDLASYTMPLAAPGPTEFAMVEPEAQPIFAFEPEPPASPAEAAPDPAVASRDAAAETTLFPAFVEAEPASEVEAEEPMIVADAPQDLPPDEPTFIMPPAPQELGPELPVGDELEVEPPAGRGYGSTPAPGPTSVPGIPVPTAAASRPTQEDLAALDELLNPATSGRAERPGERPQPEKWEPQFRPPAPPPQRPAARANLRPRASASRLPVIFAAVAGVALATVAAWYFFLRGPASARPTAATPRTAPVTTLPVVQTTPDAAVPAPATTTAAASPATPADATPRVESPVASPAVTLPAATPTPLLPATTPPPGATAVARPSNAPPATAGPAKPPAHATTAAGDARALLAQGSLPDAARAFASSLAPGARGRFSLQLLTACAPETVQKAVGAAGGPDLFILPVSLQGRSCYRVCWGLYDSRQAAEAGGAAVPTYFRQGGARPRLSVLSELLP